MSDIFQQMGKEVCDSIGVEKMEELTTFNHLCLEHFSDDYVSMTTLTAVFLAQAGISLENLSHVVVSNHISGAVAYREALLLVCPDLAETVDAVFFSLAHENKEGNE